MYDSTVKGASQTPYRVGFLLVNEFTLISLSSAVEPLRVANQLAGRDLYTWELLGEGPATQSCSDGFAVNLDKTLPDVTDYDLVIVVGGLAIEQNLSRPVLAWLRKQAQRGVVVGSVCTGAYVLASAGLLDGYQCSAHWDCLTILTDRFPRVGCNNQLYTIDRDRMTCTGGTIPMHMMLALLSSRHPQALVDAVADMLICERYRADVEMQLVPMWSRKVEMQPKLKEVLQLMEANLEEPISLQELADFVQLSRRQLERLFLKYLHCTPSRYYLKLRLDRARRLVKQSSRSIVEITSMCGFVSTTHFSRCYRKYIGVSPRIDRLNCQPDFQLAANEQLLA